MMKNSSIYFYYKKVLTLAAVLWLTANAALSVQAVPAPGTILSITDAEALENIPAVTVWENDYDALLETMVKYQYVQAEALSLTGENETLKLEIYWNLAKLTTDFTTPGNYRETAPIVAPDGYVFADGVLQSITIPVIVAEGTPTPKTITSVADISRSLGYALPQGIDWSEFFSSYFADTAWRNAVPCETEEGKTVYAHIVWTDPQPNTNITGVVQVKGVLTLPENTVLAEGTQLPEIYYSISIQSPEQPTLDIWYINYGLVNLPWVSGGAEEKNACVLVRKNGGDWTEDSGFFCDNEVVCLSLNSLEEGSYYEVRVVWDGGETNVFYFTFDGSVTNPGYIGGDRDGGDTSGNPTSNVTQPPVKSGAGLKSEPVSQPESAPMGASEPEPSQQAASAPALSEPDSSRSTNPDTVTSISEESETGNSAPESLSAEWSGETEKDEIFLEKVTDTYSLLSGIRLKLMRQTGPVRFSKQGVTVTLSDTMLDALALTDDSRFYIEIRKTANGFSLAVEVDGQSILALPDTMVTLSYAPVREDSALTLKDEAGEAVSYGSYDAELGVASFTIQAAGAYTVAESVSGIPVSEANDVGQDASLHIIEGIGVLMVLCTGILIWRRRRW